MDIIIGIVIGVSLVVICCCCLAANGRNGLYKPYSIKVDSDISQEQTPRESEMSTDMANANYKLLEVEEPQETSFSHQGRDEQILTESRTASSGVAYIISLSVDEDEPGGEQVTGTSHSHHGSDVGEQERQHNEKTIETDPCPSASSIGIISNESGGYVVCALASSTPDSQKPINQTESDPRQRDSSNGMKFSENEGYVANGCTPYPPVPPASDSQEI
ncbi:hypothetical protein SNE40_004473 [Patella caerulea]|uniref:Uncharacterized protein n=1 Tax=Patella caerulea TaxID=87958 RepID=A0AAN8K4T3_PATCE